MIMLEHIYDGKYELKDYKWVECGNYHFKQSDFVDSRGYCCFNANDRFFDKEEIYDYIPCDNFRKLGNDTIIIYGEVASSYYNGYIQYTASVYIGNRTSKDEIYSSKPVSDVSITKSLNIAKSIVENWFNEWYDIYARRYLNY